MFHLFVLFVSSRNITISKRGQTSKYTIYYPKTERGQQPWWRTAAREMQAGIKNITGEVIPMITDDNKLEGKGIFIGPTKYSKEMTTLRFTDLGLDAYEIRFVGDEHLIINGGSRGTIYGVYELLEQYAKFRFYTTWMEIYPSADEFNVDSEVNISDVAAYQYRHIWATDTILNFYHNIRKRANAGDQGLGVDYRGFLWATFGTHTFWAQMPVEEYPVDQFPEMWSLQPDGKRSTIAPCLSNQKAFDAILYHIIKAVDEDNTSSFIEVGHNDDYVYCHCPDCSAKQEKYGGRYSGVMLDFVNRLSDALKPKYPNHIIKMLAYYMTKDAPFNIVGRDNVAIKLCPIGNDIGHAVNESTDAYTIKSMQNIINWSKVVKHIQLYEYYTNFNYPMHITPNHEMIGKNLQFYTKYYIDGYMGEDTMGWLRNPTRRVQHTHMTYYRQYIQSKMMFYPDRPLRYYENDFLYGFYGAEAAAYIRRYLNVSSELVHFRPEVKLSCLGGPISDIQSDNFNYYARWLWGKAVEGAIHSGTEKQIFNTLMGEIPAMNTVYTMEKGKSWPLIVDSKGRVRCKGAQFEEIATKILDRCHNLSYVDPNSNGICAIIRFLDTDGPPIYADYKLYSEGVPAITLKSGKLKAIAGEEPAYGKVFSFTKNGEEYIDNVECLDFCMFRTFKITGHINYNMKLIKNTDTYAHFKYDPSDYTLEKTYTLNDDKLTINVKYRYKGCNTCGDFKGRPTLSVPLDLGDSKDVFYKLGDGPWVRPKFDVVATFVNHLGHNLNGEKSFSICNGRTRKGMRFEFAPSKVNYFSCCLNKSSKFIKVYTGQSYLHMRVGETYETSISLSPLENVLDLPHIDMPNLDTGDKTIHYYPMYYINDIAFPNGGVNQHIPVVDNLSFVGISSYVKTGLPDKGSMLSFSVGRDLPWVYGMHGGYFTLRMRVRCSERSGYDYPWWIGYTTPYHGEWYTGSSMEQIPEKDEYFYIDYKPEPDAHPHTKPWLQALAVCGSMYVEGYYLDQNTSWPVTFNYPYLNYTYNDNLKPMKEPVLREYQQTMKRTPAPYEPYNSRNIGLIVGLVIVGIVVIAGIIVAAFFIYKKLSQKNSDIENDETPDAKESDA
ncbi:hypothetical protein TVAG_337460 [Trichomonas vaginalis G3]|uniref:Alpha glucuronidase N-terminal domain-containing protein n=1 Tax=Trichomonas vaginalis (strain ATCC PRA-98 / G3) TaxID=412133 RepID=A2EWJ2_TRIV3|nr:coagulation factor 5/8 C-terminal domain-containing protein family [Trichomonas vaginalis G3]EAY02946.1 hypothetical protein TVAG_337460 [Trichomonas vaginalis G3]KAI5492215.1 coagulation factor 5/8 C-terminal domain-containing protein family [Trichomonas vaginalis G3]|eukprot:XP_001315169.1 hypothetical protein [Trichomonas vaginalis G3]